MRKLLDSFVGFASRWLARIFFRELEVVGRDRLPASGPLIVVANHVNSLVDPLLLLAAAGRPLRFLGKSTLWQNPFLVPVLSLAAVIPVYRRQDEGVDPAQNRETFARCHELLAKGGAIALFPEGISHNEPALAPLKTGAARIALEAEERFGPLGVKIVPVGLVFDAKEEFRSRALVEIGQPFGVEAELEQAKSAPQEASRALTGRIDQALHRVTLNYRSWGEAALIGRAADLFGRRTLAMPGERMFREDLELQRTLIDGFAELAGRYPAETRATAEAVESYDRLLRAARLRDDQVAARYPVPGVARYLLRRLALFVAGLPLGLAGALLNWLPYRLAGTVSRRLGTLPDLKATYKLFPSLLLFPLFWAGEAWLAGHYFGRWAALATLVAAPLLGYGAMRLNDRRESFWAEVRAYWLLSTRTGVALELARRRERAFAAVARLAELARTKPAPPEIDPANPI